MTKWANEKSKVELSKGHWALDTSRSKLQLKSIKQQAVHGHKLRQTGQVFGADQGQPASLMMMMVSSWSQASSLLVQSDKVWKVFGEQKCELLSGAQTCAYSNAARKAPTSEEKLNEKGFLPLLNRVLPTDWAVCERVDSPMERQCEWLSTDCVVDTKAADLGECKSIRAHIVLKVHTSCRVTCTQLKDKMIISLHSTTLYLDYTKQSRQASSVELKLKLVVIFY